LVNTHWPGGARHADLGAADGLLLLACDLSDPTVDFDRTWWDPLGMRGTASHVVRFHNTFIPSEARLGLPGQYLSDGWQSRFSPHYGATFLGGAESAYEYTLAHVQAQGRLDDPYVQHRIAAMALEVETAHLWLRHVAELWQTGRDADAKAAGNRARYVVEMCATEAIEHAVRTCGARALIRPSPLERIFRDLTFYVRHDNADHVLATVGRDLLGRPHDASFFAPVAVAPLPISARPVKPAFPCNGG
jgi:alkylation response protein AidB-like acyl-CoA dehydrogenase